MQVIGGVLCALALAVLVGWHLHIRSLIQINPALTPMQRMTALGFLLCGAGLLFLSSGRRLAAAICSAIAILQASLVCLEYVVRADYGIDQLLGTDYINVQTSDPGRMSPVTAICFLGGGVALMAATNRKWVRFAWAIVGIVAAMLIAVGTVSLLGYFTGHRETYGWSHLTRMAMHTSAAFALLGVGLLTWTWKESIEKYGRPVWLPLSIGMGVATAALGAWQALMLRPIDELPLISGVILAAGLVAALLIALAVFQAQQARKHSRELQEGKLLLERVFEASPDALLLTDGQGRIAQVNERVGQTLGYRPDELLGQSIEILVPEKLRSVHRLHREGYYDQAAMRPMGHGLELHARRKDGSEFPVEIALSPVLVSGEKRVLAVVRDITGRKQAEAALRQSEERFRNIFEQGPIGITLISGDQRMLEVNPVFCRMLGFPPEELIGRTPIDLTYPDDRPPSLQLMEDIFTGKGSAAKIEKRYVKRNGTIMWGGLTASMIRDEEGKPLYRVGMIEDITERKRAEQKLAEQAALLELANDSIAVRDLNGQIIYWNRGAQDTYGWSAEDAVGKVAHQLLQTSFPIPRLEIEAKVTAQGAWEGELEQTTKEGRRIIVTSRWSLWKDERGAPKAFLVINRDITARKHAEQKLAEQAALLDLAHDAIFVRDPSAKILFWSAGARDTYGWPAEEALGKVTHELLQTRFPIPLQEIDATVVSQGHWEGELEHTTRDGKKLIVASRWSLQRDQHGNPRAVLEINRDITTRKQMEEQLRSLSERLSLAIRSASIGVWDWDLRTSTTVWDDAVFAMFAIPKVVPMPYEDFLRRVHPDDLAKVQASLAKAIQAKTQDFVEFRIIRPDSSVRHIYAAEGVVMDEHGKVIRVVGTAVDITERKQMEAEIEANKMQLVASARLSALGMMAGGVAHEINNPLGIIHALASDLIDIVNDEGSVPPEIIKRDSVRIRDTADRIARIIRSLRHISREGSVDKLYPARVAKIIAQTLEICGERFRANGVKLLLPREIPELDFPCREVQIEQILLNLLQNAFDAVVDKPEERWVRLDVNSANGNVIFSVTDSGAGIPAEVQPHLMEPFFTTKPVGQGTGLGLSLSKSIAEQHGGKLQYSEEKGHTRFSLTLPLAREAEAVCN